MPRARSRRAAAPAASRPPRRRSRPSRRGTRAAPDASRRRWNSAALKALAMAVLLFVLAQIGILGGGHERPAGHHPRRHGDADLHAARVHDGRWVYNRTCAKSQQQKKPDGGALADRRAGPGEHLDRPPGRRGQGAADRSGRRAGQAARRRSRSWRDARGDPHHPLPLRPRRRGGRWPRPPARRSTAPRARSSCSRTSTTRALPRLRAVRELHARAHGQGRRQAAARRASRSTSSARPATARTT